MQVNYWIHSPYDENHKVSPSPKPSGSSKCMLFSLQSYGK